MSLSKGEALVPILLAFSHVVILSTTLTSKQLPQQDLVAKRQSMLKSF
jgi:hypothetical protein